MLSSDFSRHLMYMPKVTFIGAIALRIVPRVCRYNHARKRDCGERFDIRSKSLFGKAQIYSQTRMREILFGSLVSLHDRESRKFFGSRWRSRRADFTHNDGWFACSAGPRIPKSFYTVYRFIPSFVRFFDYAST